MFNNFFFFENCVVYAKMWKNMPKATNTLRICVIIAFPVQQWAQKRSLKVSS